MSPSGNTASHFTADIEKLQGEVDSDPSKAKDTIKHVFGITPGTAGEPTTASLTALQELFGSCYEDTSTLFPVGLASRCVGCITVVKSDTGYSLKHIVAPSPIYPNGNGSAAKAHGLVGFSGVDCYTRGGTTLDLSIMTTTAFFTKLSFPHALNRLRSCRVPWSRKGSTEVKSEYSTIFQKSNKIHKTKSTNEEFLVTDSNQNPTQRAGTVLTAALPAFFPIAATADFAFMSEVAIPTSITSGTDSKEWDAFKATLISYGCRKESTVLDDPFFQLWIRAVVTSPSIFAAEWVTCNYDDIDSQDAQQAAVQSMLKTKLDSLWCHNVDKRVEAYLLLLYAHSIGRPFTMDDWGDEMELESDDGKVHALEKEWWISQLEDLPEALESGEHHSNDVCSPVVDKHALMMKRKANSLANSSNKQPRSILNNISPIATNTPTVTGLQGLQPLQAPASTKVDPFKSTFSAITDRNLRNLFAYPLQSGYNYDHYLTLHDLNGTWIVFDNVSRQRYQENNRLYLLPGSIKEDIRIRGPNGISHHRSILDCNPGSRLNHANLTKDDFYCADAFGLFLKGEWDKDQFGSNYFTGFTPLMCLLLLDYCDKEVVNGIAQPIMPPMGFQKFNDILTFLDAVIALFSHFVEIKKDHHHELPLLLFEYSLLLKELENCPWGQAWTSANIDKPQISVSIMEMVHNIFARSAFHADQTGTPTKLLELDASLGGNKWTQVISSVCDFGSTTIDRYGLSVAIRGETATLFQQVTAFLKTTMFSEVKPMTVVTHWSFKPNQASPFTKKKGNQSTPFVPRDRPSIAPPTKVVLRRKAPVQELRDRFGPGMNYSNKNAPVGGIKRGKNLKVLCIDFLVGIECKREKCAYHLMLEKTSIEGPKGVYTAQDYADFREWCSKNSRFVEPTQEALKNKVLFPNGRV